MPEFTDTQIFTPKIVTDSDEVDGWRFPENVPEGTLVKVDMDDIIAGYMLDHLPDFQRPKDPGRVHLWAKLMIKKKWRRLSQAPLGATQYPTPLLVNGRHRCEAVIEAYNTNPDQEPVPFWLDMNASADDFDVMDTGKERTTSDVLANMGVKHGRQVGAAIRLLFSYDTMEHKDGNRTGEWRTLQIPTIEIREHYRPLAGKIDHRVDYIVATAKRIRFNPGALVAAYWIARRDDPDAAQRGIVDDFIDRLNNGVGEFEGDPIIALRDWSNRQSYKGHVLKAGEVKLPVPPLMLKSFINAYNNRRRGKKQFGIAWQTGRSMPILKGPREAQLTLDGSDDE